VLRCKLSLVKLCDSDFGITPIDDITAGITCAAFCFHIAHISFAISWYLFCLSVVIIIIIEFLTSHLRLGNIHLSWDAAINRIRLGGLICSLKSLFCLSVIVLARLYVFWTAMSIIKAFFVFLFIKVMSGRLKGTVLSVSMLRLQNSLKCSLSSTLTGVYL
jgi:hypothetical protein